MDFYTGKIIIQESEYDDLLEENQRYRQALEFYADKENYEVTGEKTYIGHGDFTEETWIEVDRDKGKKARKALYECPDCNGTGYDHSGSIPDHMTPCFKCRGYGTLKGEANG
ncbi:hypothetical protein RVS70_05900 [Virgibacillus sp. M23]|uniref:hypothetical protein n=1 Tax=Virgibacillus sp. M23 TaxID=3079030 RepID=UPI002A912203|nr:hypothetical protein [Virgibacillus sp. M23]MDY7043735.1 hypothetical protein [Virgibacillus sp. M23]